MSDQSLVFLVSGASRGLGRAIVEAALAAGHQVVAGVRSASALNDLTAHYHRTIEDWLAGIRAARPRIEELAPGYADTLERYLEVANAGWGYTTKHYALVCRNTRKG